MDQISFSLDTWLFGFRHGLSAPNALNSGVESCFLYKQYHKWYLISKTWAFYPTQITEVAIGGVRNGAWERIFSIPLSQSAQSSSRRERNQMWAAVVEIAILPPSNPHLSSPLLFCFFHCLCLSLSPSLNFVTLEIKPKALCFLSTRSPSELHPSPAPCFVSSSSFYYFFLSICFKFKF